MWYDSHSAAPCSAARAAASAARAVAMAEPQAAGQAGAASRPRVVGFVNRLSGGQMGARVFEAAQKAGLDVVYDLSDGGPRCVSPSGALMNASMPRRSHSAPRARRARSRPQRPTHSAQCRRLVTLRLAARARRVVNAGATTDASRKRCAPRSAGLDALLADPATAHGALLVCFGGDGTFNWVASTVLALRAEGSGAGASFAPHIVPCPLGTGNDLARSLGWGAKFPGFEALPHFVSDARAAPRGTEIDIWRLGFEKTARRAAQACVA